MKYYRPYQNETAATAKDIPPTIAQHKKHPEWTAQELAEHLWKTEFYEEDDIVIVMDDGVEHRFTVDVEHEPTFHVSRVPPAAPGPSSPAGR